MYRDEIPADNYPLYNITSATNGYQLRVEWHAPNDQDPFDKMGKVFKDSIGRIVDDESEAWKKNKDFADEVEKMATPRVQNFVFTQWRDLINFLVQTQ